MSKEEAKAKVLEEVAQADVKLIILQFVDILGYIKSATLPVEHLEEAMDSGLGFDGSSVEGFVRVFESDLVMFPDPVTFRILPWRPRDRREARIICDIMRPGGEPFEGDPRHILKRALGELEEYGFIYNTGPELEFFLLKNDGEPLGKPVPHDIGGYFDFSPLDMASDVRRDATFMLQEMGFDIEMNHHEVAPGQHEIDFKFEDALTTADSAVTFKTVIKAVAIARADCDLHAETVLWNKWVWNACQPKPLQHKGRP